MIRRKCLCLAFRRLGVTVGCAAMALLGWALISSGAEEPVAALRTAMSGPLAGRSSALRPFEKSLPLIADYIAWFRASAEFDQANYTAVNELLDPVFAQKPISPLVSRAAMLAAQSLNRANDSRKALDILRRHYASLPQPAGDLETGRALLAVNDAMGAAVYYQRVYYRYPNSNEAVEAGTQLASLRASLGNTYPPVLGEVLLGRAVKLLEAGDTARARREFLALADALTGAERDTARVKVGVAMYQARETAAAKNYLEGLTVESAAAGAERFYYLFQCARRSDDDRAQQQILTQFANNFPASKYRMDALMQAAGSYLIDNNWEQYEPLYRACYESFPKDPKAAVCHWKVTWSHYLHRQDDAANLLREQIQMFPDSDDAPAALYYQARLAEAASDRAGAVALYQRVARDYPNRYYAVPARLRISEQNGSIEEAPSSRPSIVRDFQPDATNQLRWRRAQLLQATGLDEYWPIELRYAGDKEAQPHVAALFLARLEAQRGAQDQALRYIKHYVPDYLSMSVVSTPAEFWRLAFPLPYRNELDRFSREHNLDPFLLAALVRQESEFNPKAVSVTSARGLAQIMPATGKDLSRRLGIKPYSTAQLFQPHVNLRLGAYYLRTVADRLEQRWEAVLAAYNAGPSRAAAWSRWSDFREPSEFIESIPFTQTRDYVQIVLRNADLYHRLYPEGFLAATSASAAQEPVTKAVSAPRNKTARAAANASTRPRTVANRATVANNNRDAIDQPRKSSRATGAR